jgi:phosphatidylglycerol:prolipoprotein diacylglycerol transferase
LILQEAQQKEHAKMFVHNIDPTLLNIGPFEIRYYGLVYVIGFLFVFFYLKNLVEKKKLKLKKEELYDYLFYLLIAVLIGGRLFHVLVYNPTYYIANPVKIFAIWNGGMAFHGALLGILLATYLFTKKHKIKFYDLLDNLVIPASFFLFLGRIANFLNGELFGTPSTLPWAVRFPDPKGGHFPDYRHPSQIYEALKNLGIFFFLIFESKKKTKPGYLTWMFIFLYGILRFLIEFVRFSHIRHLGLSIGQYLCLIMVIVSGYILIKNYWKNPKS